MTASPAPLTPPRRDLVIWKGDNDPVVEWRFGSEATPNILDGSNFSLTVQWATPGDDLVISTDPTNAILVISREDRTVTWAYSVEQTLEMPRGAHSYELKRLIDGHVRTWVWGTLTVMSGLRRG